MITRPVDPAGSRGAGAWVRVFTIIDWRGGGATSPRKPTSRMYGTIQRGLHYNCSRILLPWPTKICDRLRPYLAVLYRNACVLIRASATLRSHKILLSCSGIPGKNITVLENHCWITKNEIYCAINVRFSIELSFGKSIESVLITIDWASKDYCSIGSNSKGNSLVLARTGTVHKRYVFRDESIPHHA